MITTLKKRDDSIDILKCLAALIITNSHMEILYPPPFDTVGNGRRNRWCVVFLLLGIYAVPRSADGLPELVQAKNKPNLPDRIHVGVGVSSIVLFYKEYGEYRPIWRWMVCQLYYDLLCHTLVHTQVFHRKAHLCVCIICGNCCGMVCSLWGFNRDIHV